MPFWFWSTRISLRNNWSRDWISILIQFEQLKVDQIKIRIFWSHRIIKLFEFWFWSTYNRSNWSKIEILNNSKVDQNRNSITWSSILERNSDGPACICLTWLILSLTKRWTPTYRGRYKSRNQFGFKVSTSVAICFKVKWRTIILTPYNSVGGTLNPRYLSWEPNRTFGRF